MQPAVSAGTVKDFKPVTPVSKIIVGESFTLSTSRSLQRRPYSLKTRKHSVFKNEGCRAFTRQPYRAGPNLIISDLTGPTRPSSLLRINAYYIVRSLPL